MNRSPRTINAPKKYSPSQPTLFSQENYLLRFEDNAELIIVKRSSIKSIIEDKAVVGIGSKRRLATIEAKGTYGECNNMYEQLQSDAENAVSDQEDILDEINDCEDDDRMDDRNDQDEMLTQSVLTKKRKFSSRIIEDSDEDINDNNTDTQKHATKNKKCRRVPDDSSPIRNDVLINRNNKENETAETRLIYQTIDDMHHAILQNLEKKFSSFSKKLNQLVPHAVHQNLDSYRDKDEIFPTQVIFDDKNLLEIRGRDIYYYGRQILKILYTPKELSSSILPPARSHLARPALDPERFNIFHEAVRVKYRISFLHYDNCYAKLIRPRMCDFLIDERKRQAKALKQQANNIQEQNINID